MKNNLYQVTIKLSAPGYGSKFIRGIAGGTNAEDAKQKVVSKLQENDMKTSKGGAITITATKCAKLPTAFVYA